MDNEAALYKQNIAMSLMITNVSSEECKNGTQILKVRHFNEQQR